MTDAWARLKRLLFSEHTGAGRLSAAVGLGVFIGLTPFFGLHALLGLAVARLLRLNMAVTVLATQISSPLFAAVLIPASIWLGNLIGGAEAAASGGWDPTRSGFWIAWLKGGVVLGGAAGVLCAAATWAIMARARWNRHA